MTGLALLGLVMLFVMIGAIFIGFPISFTLLFLALVFNAGVWHYAGSQKALEFFTGYLIEKSLSVDNIFVFALLFIYLVLAAQFESFSDPLIIMLTVPLAVTGALLSLKWTGGTLNVYSQIGMIMLIGLVTKNGILIVEFANQLRDEGRKVREAIIEASAIRMRPVLMTSIATVAGALPLMLGDGAGSASRNSIGIVIVFGVTLSTLLTLYVIPALYLRVAPYTTAPEARGRELDRLEAIHVDGEARA